MAEISREQLQKVLAERHGEDFRQKLHDSSAAVAGLGGLGSNIAVMLARAGIGRLLLVDFDRVELSNINRQQYFLEHIGMYKTDALSSLIRRINPYMEIQTVCARITADNAPELFDGERYIAEALDRAEEKAMLINTVLEKLPQAVVVSASGMAGYGDAGLIRTQRRMSRLYVCGDGRSGIEGGASLMAPRVAVCAGHQANKIIQLIMEEQ